MLQREPRPPRNSRSLTSAVILGGLAASLGAVVYARFIEPNLLCLRSIELAVPTLPADLDGMTFAFLSDFHIGGPGDNTRTTQRAIDAVEHARPDLILLGGDYYDDGKREWPGPDWSRFSTIAPTYAVLGNHDYYHGPRATANIIDTLEHSGITVLRNEAVHAPVRGQCVGLIGVDDGFTGRADFQSASQQLDQGAYPRILLTHAGLLADSLPIGAADLIVSGHTHGGQVRISPFRHTSPLDAFWWLDVVKDKRISPYRQGMFYVRGSLLYVANGVGTTTLGVRFLAPPEVTFFTLRQGPGLRDHRCDTPERYILSSSSRWVSA